MARQKRKAYADPFEGIVSGGSNSAPRKPGPASIPCRVVDSVLRELGFDMVDRDLRFGCEDAVRQVLVQAGYKKRVDQNTYLRSRVAELEQRLAAAGVEPSPSGRPLEDLGGDDLE